MRTPQTVMEWLQMYHRLRRPDYPTEDAFRKRMRVLFKVSSFVRYKSWKLEDLEAALDAVRDEPVPDLPAKKPGRPVNVRRDRRPETPEQPGQSGEAESLHEAARRRRIQRALARGPKALTCLDCGGPLPSDRKRRGRCEPFRAKRRRISQRHAKRRWRKKCDVGLSIT